MFELCQLNRLNALLGVIFMILVIGSIQYASADHSLGGQGIFKNENDVNLASTIDSKWLIHLQVVVRDAQDQLVSVTEVAHGSYIPHQVSDYIFDEYLGEKEIINMINPQNGIAVDGFLYQGPTIFKLILFKGE